MTDNDKLLCAKIADLYKKCERNCAPAFSDFLDGAEQCTVRENCFSAGFNTEFFGGFPEAERKVFGVFPEWEEPDDFPIMMLEITHTFGDELSHRDYLGSILGLGIDRCKTGDILIEGNTAFVFVLKSMADFIADNLKKIGSRGVKVKILNLSEVKIPERKFLMINAVCASTRLDAVLGACINSSRAKSAALIEAGLVKVNHKEVFQGAKQVETGDLISARGHGRFILSEVGNETRSGRIHINIKKFI